MKALNKILHHTWKPILEGYLSKDRRYRYKGIDMLVYKDVFHPGFFYSTKYLVNFLESFSLDKKSFLEVGCGSGLISIFAAKQGAMVTGLDISPAAQKCTSENALKNNVTIKVLLSDMFSALPDSFFDIVMINPPYFKKDPQSFAEHAWCAGTDLQYFEKMFGGLKKVMNDKTLSYMILADNCDLELIEKIAKNYNYKMNIIHQKKIFFETNYIFELKIC